MKVTKVSTTPGGNKVVKSSTRVGPGGEMKFTVRGGKGKMFGPQKVVASKAR